MSLIKKNEDYPVMSNFFKDFFDNTWLAWNSWHYSDTNTTIPSVNVKESPDSFDVEMAAPGMEKKDFKIEFNHGLLTISSEKKLEKETKEGKRYSKCEFSYQSFSRSLSFPDTVNSDNISAKYENGILKVHCPKKEVAKQNPAKQIEIK